MSGTDDLPEALERLVTLGQTPDVNIRPVLLRVVVDLFVGKPHHAPADLQQFEAIVSHLLDNADLDARLIVADKLSRHPATPRGLLERFIADRSAIASRIYANASLDEATLLSAATWGPGDIAAVVAGRTGLSTAVVTALAQRTEDEVLRALARNTAVALDRISFQRLARRAAGAPDLAECLIGRAEDPMDLAPLFPLVRSSLRQSIIDSARRLELGKRQWGRTDGVAAETLDRLDRLVLSGERDAFETTLGQALGLDNAVLGPLLGDEGGEVLALALAALGASPEMAARVFILGDPRIGRSLRKVRALVEIVETLSSHAARCLIGAMTGASLEGARRSVRQAPSRRAEPQATAFEPNPIRRELPAAAPNRARSA